MTINGQIIVGYGRQFIVEVKNKSYQAVTKGKKTDYVVGDIVSVTLINEQQAQIDKLLTRDHLVYRSDRNKSKMIASNIDQMLIITALKPQHDLNFINRCLIFAHSADITPLIVINKVDLDIDHSFSRSITALYHEQLGYKVVELIAQHDCNSLLPMLQNKCSLLIGQSGMGKSTIISKLIPDNNVRIGDISDANNAGKHTTTYARLYHINTDTHIIDCPGLQQFGLHHLQLDKLGSYFPELTDHLGACRFRNCHHLNEPGCAITDLYQQGIMDSTRFNLLQDISRDILNKIKYRHN